MSATPPVDRESRSTSPPRPPRPPAATFYLHSRGSDDDFYGSNALGNTHPLSSSLVADDGENQNTSTQNAAASDTGYPVNVFADPAPAVVHDPYRFPLSFRAPNPFNPGLRSSSAPFPSTGNGATLPRGQHVPPPSAYIERTESPGLPGARPSSRTTQLSDSDIHVAPDRPFARMPTRMTEAARSDSAVNFAPAPQPWISTTSRSNSADGNMLAAAAAAGLDQPLKNRIKKKASFTPTILKNPIEKPWLSERDPWATFGQWLTRLIFLLGVGAAGAICYLQISSIPQLGKLCLVLDDNFNTLDTNIWQREVAVGDFGNGEFQWYTANTNNSFVQNGKLYIVPTLTSDAIGENAVLNGGTISLGNACTAVNSTGCTATGDSTAGTVINPVQSAMLTTKLSHAIQYGRVEVTAKMPEGDWLWPAIWMLPSNETYGPWPMSGEIDIAESKGNGLAYSAQGSNFVSSALHWGPITTMDAWTRTWGWIEQRRTSYADGFHTYAVDWSPEFMRFYIDTKTVSSLLVNFKKKSLFDQGNFPQIITQGANQAVLKNPWQSRGKNAPFDQPFYLILNVAVGGTNGWFPDGVGNKPWVDQSATAMRDFALQQSTWSKTWPQSTTRRAMIVDSVKMWRTC